MAVNNIFFIPEETCRSKIVTVAHTPKIGTVINSAMRVIETNNKKLKNALSKNYGASGFAKFAEKEGNGMKEKYLFDDISA